jgi:type III restriction enzyme
LRLPYGKRTGVTAVDRLNIIAHDKFQEIVDEAKRPDSQIRMTQLILVPESLKEKTETFISQPQLDSLLGFQPNTQLHPPSTSITTQFPQPESPPIFKTPTEQKIAQFTYAAIRKLETQTDKVPTTAYLASPTVQALVRESVTQAFKATEIQLELEGIVEKPDLDAIISKTTELIIDRTIDIPRIIVVPSGEVRSGFHPFALDLVASIIRLPLRKSGFRTLTLKKSKFTKDSIIKELKKSG